MDYSKSKFDGADAESLYGETPDEEAGSVHEQGWYGFYKTEAIVLHEDSQGFVWTFYEVSQEQWDYLVDELEEGAVDVPGFRDG